MLVNQYAKHNEPMEEKVSYNRSLRLRGTGTSGNAKLHRLVTNQWLTRVAT